MKTLFISSFHSIISKNIINSTAFRVLADAADLRIVVFVPEQKKKLFEQYYGRPNVVFEGIDVTAIADDISNSRALSLARLLLNSHYLWYKKAERFHANPSVPNGLKYLLELLATKLFARSTFIHRLYRRLNERMTPIRFDSYFKKYNPACVFATDIFDKVDTVLIGDAKQRGVPVVGMVRSWDNCYSKGLLRFIPDKLLVNTRELRRQLERLHDVPSERIEEVGLPQFDAFLSERPMAWEEFCEDVGLRKNRELVLFSPLGSPLSKVDWQILQILKDAITNGALPNTLQILVRLHPGRSLPLGDFEPNDHFVFDTPGVGEGKDVEFLPRDVTRLFNSLYHARVVVWVATTLGIDAAILNKPQVVANFDGFERPPYIESVHRYHDEDHMKQMLDLGGVRIASSRNELIEAIHAYLNDPSLDRDGREKVVAQQIQYTDGKSGERVARAVLAELDI